jgi:mRNA interferase MazF
MSRPSGNFETCSKAWLSSSRIPPKPYRRRIRGQCKCCATRSSRMTTPPRGGSGRLTKRPPAGGSTPLRMASAMRRGEIWQVDLDPVRGGEASKQRPAVIVSNDRANASAARLGRGVVTVVPVTSNTGKIYPFQVLLSAASALAVESNAQAEQIRSIATQHLLRRVGRILLPHWLNSTLPCGSTPAPLPSQGLPALPDLWSWRAVPSTRSRGCPLVNRSHADAGSSPQQRLPTQGKPRGWLVSAFRSRRQHPRPNVDRTG